MSRIDESCLPDLAFLYLCMAHGSRNYLTDSELEAVTRTLTNRSISRHRDEVQPLVMEALEVYIRRPNLESAVDDATTRLRAGLTRRQRTSVLEDLTSIGEADGVLQDRERRILDKIAARWELARSEDAAEQDADNDWGVLHDLAYLYLVLAHGTDDDLTQTEMQVMLNKLREWKAGEAPEDVHAVLKSATSAYSRGPNAQRLQRAIESVRRGLPREQRMAALNDLVKIANADGVFLDDEEDLINQLMNAWDVDPYANYGSHGSKP